MEDVDRNSKGDPTFVAVRSVAGDDLVRSRDNSSR